LSLLTKILIVLLTISSIFLCGIVVTYVSTADNYKEKYNSIEADRDSLKQKLNGRTEQLNETIAKTDDQIEKLTNEIASLKANISKVQSDLDTAERNKAALLQEASKWKAITKDFYETNDKQGQLLKNTLDELNKVKTQQIEERKELKETTASLIEKMAIIETLQSDKKQLLEQQSDLQSKLDQLLQPIGKRVAPTVPVTLPKTTARLSMPAAKDIALKGLVTAVDAKNSMASISIGKANGVELGMKFHVTRGSDFIRDILIINVEAEEAIGVFDIGEQLPRVGDNVSTNL